MSHFCICPKCNQKFDRDKIQAVKVSARRYGHATCYPDNNDYIPLPKKEINEDYQKLMDYIQKKYGDKANYALINKQIKTYTTENNYSLSGILKSLVYFYDIKHNSVEQSNGGIGIVPFCYQTAYEYYYSLFIAEHQNEGKDIKEVTSKVREITIPLPKIEKKKRLFKFLEETDE